jgi:hypothetical protein
VHPFDLILACECKDLNALHVDLGINNVYMFVENLVLHARNYDNVNPIF